MIQLPETKSEVSNYNPKLLIICGKPKSGKSTVAAALENNLIIDLEDGYRSLSVLKVQARTSKDLFDIREALIAKGKQEGKVPYRFITIDNATRLEEIALSYAAQLYRSTPMGVGWGYLKDERGQDIRDPRSNKPIPDPKADVRMLANGQGWLYSRLAIRKLIDMFKPLCETLILICHIKDRQIRKNAEEVSEISVDLAGKTGDIICGEADACGYLYREDNKTYLSFEGGGDVLREARPLHLRGKKLLLITSDEENKLSINISNLFI